MVVMATLADTLKDLGALCLALSAIVAFFALLARLRPVKWVWRKLVAEPFAAWFRSVFRAELERTNGGSSFYDRLVSVEKGGAVRDERLQRIEQALGVSSEEN